MSMKNLAEFNTSLRKAVADFLDSCAYANVFYHEERDTLIVVYYNPGIQFYIYLMGKDYLTDAMPYYRSPLELGFTWICKL